MKVVPFAGKRITTGFRFSGLQLYEWSSIPENIMARSSERKVNAAEKVAAFESALNVFGRENRNVATAVINANVRHGIGYSAPTT
jgi:ABC-type nitrate/sulfonate/bicarbonate transport system ATPase subunit